MIFFLGLIPAILSSAPLRADYLITRIDGTSLRTQSYWVQGSKLHLAENPEPLDAYGVKSVTGENLSPEELKAHEAALETFRSQVFMLLDTERELSGVQEATLTKISGFPVGKKNALPREEKKALKASLTAQREKISALLDTWRHIRLPDFSLIKMRDIKELQLLSLEASLRQALKFAQKNDPSYFEYAQANMREYVSFESAFREALPWK